MTDDRNETPSGSVCRYEAVIFDMDGTVLDTVEDLKVSINYAMSRCGHRCDFTDADTRCFFGSGAYTAVQRALAMEAGADRDALYADGNSLNEDPEETEKILSVFRPYYEAHCRDTTSPYSGITELLQELQEEGIRAAVVSNKPDPAVQLLAEKHFKGLFDAVCGEKAGVPRKPSPDMVWQVLGELGVSPEAALYVGDSEIDALTAGNAGMDCCLVTWGFRPAAFLRSLDPKKTANTAEELKIFILEGV